jgi:rod shape-determining protein MreB
MSRQEITEAAAAERTSVAPAATAAGAPRTRIDRLAEQDNKPTLPMGHGEYAMYVGIDLGTSRTSIAASNGQRHTVRSWVGYPKDIISRKRLSRDVLIGDEALDNRLALDMVKPLKRGVIDGEDPRCQTAVQELLKHIIGLCGPTLGRSVYAVIGVPARASIENQKSILTAAKSFVTSAMVASEPFSVAYGLDLLTESLVVDIGAGTTDLCRMPGTMPDESDQITLNIGGDSIDERLEQEILKLYPDVQLTHNMARILKEKHGFVSDPNRRCVVTLTEMGRPKQFDITDPLREACTSIVPEIISSVHRLIGTFDPEFQSRLRHNVVLAGGGSCLNGLVLLVEEGLEVLGGGRVVAVEEPMYAGANGALKMATEMPAKYWKYRTL